MYKTFLQKSVESEEGPRVEDKYFHCVICLCYLENYCYCLPSQLKNKDNFLKIFLKIIMFLSIIITISD